MDVTLLKQALRNNLDWFENSGVMDPSDGSWGVGERVVLTKDNSSLAKTYSRFPFYVERDGFTIMEHRRADCCFQAAWLYLLASQTLQEERYLVTARNLLKYLFCRSGLYNTYRDNVPHGIWQWSMPQVQPTYWLDDNSWNSTICLAIADNSPELAKEFPLVEAGMQTAKVILESLGKILQATTSDDKKQRPWMGCVRSPHWGAFVCMAFAWAFKNSGQQNYLDGIMRVIHRMQEHRPEFSASEHAYVVAGLSSTAELTRNQEALDAAVYSAEYLLKVVSPDGHFPSQWGMETPTGKHLVDLIYTQNWATLGFQKLALLTERSEFRNVFEKSLELLMNIQDSSPQPHLKGCWRGLFDMDSNQWGGGDCYEGGANSIYSGWTNAPTSIAIALELLAMRKN